MVGLRRSTSRTSIKLTVTSASTDFRDMSRTPGSVKTELIYEYFFSFSSILFESLSFLPLVYKTKCMYAFYTTAFEGDY